MSHHDHDDHGVSRRKVLECMTWAGTGVLWTISGGVPRSLGLVDAANAAEKKASGLTFLQISDSHVGFDKPANPNALGTLEEAIGKINTMPAKPSFMIHTGDISHLSKASEFDDADRIISQAKLDVHYVPGEHDFLDEEVKFYKERYGKGSRGAGWYSFDANGVHFIGLVNVVDLKAGGLGNLGAEQLEWLETDLKGRSKSTPVVVFAHIPLWTVYPQWGWGTEDGARALDYLKGFGSVTVLNGHIHQVMQKVEGNVTFHTARSTAFPQPAPRNASPSSIRRCKAEKDAHHMQRRDLLSRGASVAATALLLWFATGSAHAETVAVSIDNFTFAPVELKLKVGDTVTWTNHDDIPHTVVSAGKFRSKTLDTDDSFAFTFTTAGDYKCFCSLHPHMTGMIKVE
jgi:plastocyanin